MKITIMVNPNAGRQQIVKEIEGVWELLASAGNTVDVVTTETTEQAEKIIESAAKERPDLLVCCGGDGTLSATVGRVLDLDAAGQLDLGYIPAGTTNDFGNFLRIPKDPLKAADIFLTSHAQPLDVGLFGENRKFMYVASFGAFTRASYDTDPELKHTLGHLAYLLEGFRELPEIRPVNARVETAEGEIFEGDYLFGALASSTSIGGMMKLDPHKVHPADGFFELILIRNPRNLLEFNRIVGSLMSGKYDEELITFTHTKQAVFRFREPLDWSLDGEYASGGETVTVGVLPRAIKMYY